MDDQQIRALDNAHLAVLAGLEEPLRREKEAAAAAYKEEHGRTHKCTKCGNRESKALVELKRAWTYATQAWGAAERARGEVVRRIDPEKRQQKRAAEAARVRALELQTELSDARRVFREADAKLKAAQEDPSPDRTLIADAKATLAEAAERVKVLGAEVETLTAKQTSVTRLLEDAVTEFLAKHQPKGKALEQIEQELRGAILPKPTAKSEAKRAGGRSRAGAASA